MNWQLSVPRQVPDPPPVSALSGGWKTSAGYRDPQGPDTKRHRRGRRGHARASIAPAGDPPKLRLHLPNFHTSRLVRTLDPTDDGARNRRFEPRLRDTDVGERRSPIDGTDGTENGSPRTPAIRRKHPPSPDDTFRHSRETRRQCPPRRSPRWPTAPTRRPPRPPAPPPSRAPSWHTPRTRTPPTGGRRRPAASSGPAP